MPWAMLMMSSTPKISVSPTAISAYTPPMSIPSMIAREELVSHVSSLVHRCALGQPGSASQWAWGKDLAEPGAPTGSTWA
jgi:hypothetical protein